MRPQPERLYYLDAMRGIASIIVACFFHYQHFKVFADSSIPPFYQFSLFKLFYEKADVMVDLFFVLSGLIFSYTYQESVKTRLVNTKEFFGKRLTRLYPTHLLTLLATTVIITAYYYRYSTYPIYQNNSLFAFILNLFFIQHGLFDTGYSFNGPAWSLSIEMMMYVLFFVQARYFKTTASSVALIIVGLIFFFSPVHLRFLMNMDVARGLIGFFSGRLIYQLIRNKSVVDHASFLTIAILLLAGFCFYILKLLPVIPLNIKLVVLLVGIIPFIHYNKIINRLLTARWLIVLGDISLSVYLIHVPIQMIILFVQKWLNKPIHYSALSFLSFYILLVVTLGYFLHYYVEKPMQVFLRKKLYS
ncbi:acyltransferase family protein [Spirosoma gilvum]